MRFPPLGLRSLPFVISAALLVFFAAGGCGGAPEQCHGCLGAVPDSGGPDAALPSSGGTGGESLPGSGGVQGNVGTGGVGGAVIPASTGGTSSGGASTGGMTAATGGAPGGAAGGPGTGGAPQATGGAPQATGGSATGGAPAGTGGAATGGAPAGTGGAGGDAALVLWYKFDEGGGTSAADSAMVSGVARNATLMSVGTGMATFSTTRQVGTHGLSLVGSSSTAGGFVIVPALQTLAPAAVTFATWVNLSANTAAQNWERVFDFGVSSTINMFLTARAGVAPNAVRFGITTSGGTGEERLTGTTILSPGVWHHLAVVLAAGTPYTGRLYIDGVETATNATMTLHPGDLGGTTANYIGRSGYPVDPYFSGYVDDFRVYNRALTATELTALFAFR